MKTLKHVGKMINTGAKVLVVFRTLPGESNFALVLPTATLPDHYHDSLISLVESDQAQDTNEFGEIMFIRHFPDGRPMLQAMQLDGRMQKVATDSVMMTPTLSDSIRLDELNMLIAQQRNCAVDDLSSFVTGGDKSTEVNTVTNSDKIKTESNDVSETVLTDKDLAKSYRSQADAMYKEAARLRKQADELDPPAKKKIGKLEIEVSE